eukprot:TRINITY_DN66191_c5_g1_i1.p1 TRINITY_DN66191_c5_g1~~TRINITY_DN66191_c5_g1_i1.p1  ORF type:complete len:179 (-),score=94.94 TRINITY_DN66191_c5_g1_i1:206-742(-)
MGANTSQLTSEEVEDLAANSPYSASDIKKLYKRFSALDRNHSGTLSTDEFQLIPELSMNPLCHRIIALFDVDGTDRVNFEQFVRTLSVFHPSTPPEVKRKFAFKIYDVDGDGLVSERDLFAVLKLLVGSNLDDDQLHLIVHKTMQDLDVNHDGGCSEQEFSKVISKEQYESVMTISLL